MAADCPPVDTDVEAAVEESFIDDEVFDVIEDELLPAGGGGGCKDDFE